MDGFLQAKLRASDDTVDNADVEAPDQLIGGLPDAPLKMINFREKLAGGG